MFYDSREDVYVKRVIAREKKYRRLSYYHKYDQILLDAGFTLSRSQWSAKKNDLAAGLRMKKGQHQRWIGRYRGNWNQKEQICKGISKDEW